MWKVQLFKLNFDELEEKAVSDVVKSGWLTMGENTIAFENEFSNFLGKNVYCRAVSNGTAALHMALLALEVTQGDEVIIPALTFVADANVVNLVGAKPVLSDVTSINDWNMSFDAVQKKITNKTKAVIVVHYAGYPCKDIEKIAQLCKRKGIGLIEDVAHAPGASINNKKCGTFGDIGCFSFFSNKNLSIGEGGMVTTLSDKLDYKLGHLRSHGMSTLTLDRHKGRAITYDVITPGLNYRIDEIRAAIGIVQLKKLSNGNDRRRLLTERYRFNFTDSNINIPFENLEPNILSVYHILPILLPDDCDRINIISYLKEKGIQSSIHYPPFWNFTAFNKQFSPDDAPTTSKICTNQLTLPLFPTMTFDEVDLVSKSVIESISQ
jgi:dTDP-4-amino-4,6-dideoxygalactose transaminase